MSYPDACCCICARSTHTFDELRACLAALKNRDDPHKPTEVASANPVRNSITFSLRCPPCGRRMIHKDGYYRCEKCKVVV